jgi:DNA polymerase I
VINAARRCGENAPNAVARGAVGPFEPRAPGGEWGAVAPFDRQETARLRHRRKSAHALTWSDILSDWRMLVDLVPDKGGDVTRPLLVVDGDSFAHRAYHGVPKSIRRHGNKGGGAIVGFANFLLRLYAQEKPRAVLVGWDTLDAPTYRHQALETYQSGRVFDAELLDQLDVLPQFVAACGFAYAKAPGYEADDFLAAAVAQEERRGGMAIVASGDRDAFQLASDKTTILQPVRAGEMARIGPADVRERYGVDPDQVPDFIALRGDPSDKIPGVPGIGPKGAASLLRRHGSLEAALAQGSFAAQAEKLRLYRSIATMDASAPLPSLDDQTPTWRAAAALAREWELNQLADRLAAIDQ